MNWDHIYHISELLGLLTVLWKGNRAINRLIDVLKDFPPHRHENGLVIYPKDYEPGEVKRIA